LQHGLASRTEIRKSLVPAAHGSVAEIVPESGAQRGVFQQCLQVPAKAVPIPPQLPENRSRHVESAASPRRQAVEQRLLEVMTPLQLAGSALAQVAVVAIKLRPSAAKP